MNVEGLSLSGRVAVVTGSSRGIGRAAANCLASLGADVLVNYTKNEGAAKDVVGELSGRGVKAFAVRADVSRLEDAERLIKEAFERFGRVDILVCNAGV